MLGWILATCLSAGGCETPHFAEGPDMCYYCGKVLAQARCTCNRCDRAFCYWDKNPWAPARRCKDCSALDSTNEISSGACKTHGGTAADASSGDRTGGSITSVQDPPEAVRFRRSLLR